MLSMNNDSTEETRWLRTKFGFVNETDDRIRLASDVAEVNVLWSSVMQFSGSLANVGALIFIYEGPAHGAEPDAQALLHEIVRQTSLQSRYQYPVLIINFNENSTNASEVFSDVSYMINVLGSQRLGFTDTFEDDDIGARVSSANYWRTW